MRQLDHPNVVHLYGVSTMGWNIMLVMELVSQAFPLGTA